MRKIILGILLIACSLGGCTTLSTAPIPVDALSEYRRSIEQLRVESDRALGLERELAYSSFVERTRAADTFNPLPFRLTFPEGDFSWQVGNNPAEQAEFLAIDSSRRRLNGLHQIMFDYLDVLTQLNSSGEPAAERISASTDKLSTSVTSLANQLKTNVDAQKVGVFETVANEFASQVIQRMRNSSLQEVMTDFQPGLIKLSEIMALSIGISATGIKESYQNNAPPLIRLLATAPENQRQALLEQLLRLNERTTEQLDLLRELAAAYNALPGGHAKLIQAMRAGTSVQLTSLIASINAIADIRTALETDVSDGE